MNKIPGPPKPPENVELKECGINFWGFLIIMIGVVMSILILTHSI